MGLGSSGFGILLSGMSYEGSLDLVCSFNNCFIVEGIKKYIYSD